MHHRTRGNIGLNFVLWLLFMQRFVWGEALANETVRFTIPAEPRKISPYIYGLGTYMHENRDLEKVWEIRPTLYRWGGNTSSRFNFKLDAWNTGSDWYFRNIKSSKPKMIERFMADNLKHQTASAITLPMLAWIAKDGSSFSFPRSRFPSQQAYDGEAGNGLSMGGRHLPTDPGLTSIPNSPAFVGEWVQQLKTQFGQFPHFYIMDNEPMLWNSTHRDVQQEPMRYETYFSRYVAFAEAVRKADPEAVIIGPASWGWLEMNYSAWDIEGPHSNGKRHTDRKAHGNKPFLEWFLDELKKKEQELKISLLDQIDVHHYPEKDRWPGGGDKNPKRRQALFNSTRSLWDPNYTDQSWINEKMYLIPRLKEMANRFKPGTKVSIGEYNFRAERDVSGAIVQAELLGIFAMTGLDAAQYWDFPRRNASPIHGFRLFRNYDGNGSGFGDEWIENSLGIQNNRSVFAARNSRDKLITVVILNKIEDPQTIQLDLSGFPTIKSGQIFSFVSPRKDESVQSSQQKLKVDSPMSLTMEGMSMHMVELRY